MQVERQRSKRHSVVNDLLAGGVLALAICGVAAPAMADPIMICSCSPAPPTPPSPVFAPNPVSSSYTISLPNYAVTDIVIINEGFPFTTFVQGPTNAPLSAGTPGPTTVTQTYLTAAQLNLQSGSAYVPGVAFLLGVATNFVGDAPGQQHLVLFTNDAFAVQASNVAFGTLFPNTDETTLINDLVTETNPGDLLGFASGDAEHGRDGYITFNVGGTFTALAFSSGQIIGSGTSVNNFAAAVPEPASLAIILAGLVGLGARRNTKRRPTILPA